MRRSSSTGFAVVFISIIIGSVAENLFFIFSVIVTGHHAGIATPASRILASL